MKYNIGDIGLCASGKPLGRIIRFFMKIQQKKKGLANKKVWSHAFIIISDETDPLVLEATLPKVRCVRLSRIEKHYKENQIKFIEPTAIITYQEQLLLTRYALVQKCKWYQFGSLVHQLIWILTGRWMGDGDNNEIKFNCSELVASAWDNIRPGIFGKEERANPLTIDLNQNFTDK